ncbi:translation initiation factor IF-2 [Microbulbifer thermotolerans]|uniref:translation initiation factor IF-2 n=1 Tax=Microbulbifer thermotolerans TaxID=252514 RepID=UPI0022492DE5|nr:translation initiation factor IF-2 [Microbulbifer thermotolerans]MCX2779238.1 translation initiation factor IF-2 [Microbulbifer thermotolerans]MCX2803662.1 translation initiation factor IF-2 [Microbulbifer thermotolerans]MCX2830425.1 translation initiation factor IF-2 [Microbulbifer thermotolerans]
MAEVTVSELAKSVGATEDRLLKQMKEAGLPHTSADAVVSDEEKQVLLNFLKSSHGEQGASPRKITLKRKTTTTLKTGSGAGRKTVNVEVRKKRTYVKRPQAELEAEAAKQAAAKAELEKALAEQAALEKARAEQAAAERARAEAEAKAAREAEEAAAAEEEKKAAEKVVEEPEEKPAEAPEEKKAEPEAQAEEKGEEKEEKADKPPKKPAAPVRTSYVDDIEAMRIAAMERRRQQAEQEQRELEEKKARLEAERARAEQEKKEKEKEKEKARAEETAKPSLRRKQEVTEDERDGGEPRKRRGRRAKSGPKKTSRTALYEQALEAFEEDEAEKRSTRSLSRPAIKIKPTHGFKKPTGKQVYEVQLGETITVGELAKQMNIKAGELIKRLMKMGEMVTINQSLDRDTAQLIVEEMGHKVVLVSETQLEESLIEEAQAVEGKEVSRAPVVTVMGHVDHGKTSLLDYIRKTKVASGEAGGITQHIGAYRVKTSHGEITFLDTPGHAAFTAMRARGAQATDVVILVVAADDGVMPQTEEAINHARAAGVPLVVAINKCDKEAADPDRVKNELAAKDVIPEDWGGDIQFVNVSAHTGQGIDELLEAVSLQAEILELKAKVGVPATGVVIESRLEKGRGVVATLLVQNGELRRGDIVLAGQSYGRVRAMTNELGQKVKEAGPSTPVELLGLDTTPNAGDDFLVVADERKAREVAEQRAERERRERMQRQQAAKLENMFADMEAGEKKVLPVVIKADVRGSLEAILGALADIGNEEVSVNVVSSGVGGIAENDINLALTAGAIVIGFNTRADSAARKLAEQESVEIRYYSVIYNLLDEVKQALSGMLEPEVREEIVGIAEVRDVFRSPKFGAIAGCMVTEGTVYRNKPIRVLRDNVVIFQGELESLRRFKDDVQEVRNGMECGIGVKDYNDVKPGDQIEVYDIVKVAREL